MGSEEFVALGDGISLNSHPVTEEQGGEETEEVGVDRADVPSPDVNGPANNPETSKTFNLL